MIIFDLDGTLADCEHRRHFVRPVKKWVHEGDYWPNLQGFYGYQSFKEDGSLFEKPDWKSFYESCDQDTPILSTVTVIRSMLGLDYYDRDEDVHIWSGRCASVREKTEKWLDTNRIVYNSLKMRPIGDNTPDDVLKERWLDEALSQGKTIDFVFDHLADCVRMWRRRGIFVFDCNQSGREF
jgi:hypothetical protein